MTGTQLDSYLNVEVESKEDIIRIIQFNENFSQNSILLEQLQQEVYGLTVKKTRYQACSTLRRNLPS